MRQRGLCCHPMSARLSVRLSHWCIVSRRLKISSYFLIGPVAHHSSFLTASAGTNSKGRTPSVGAQNTRGWEKFAIFDWNFRLSRKRYEIGPWLLWNVNRKYRWRIDTCPLRWPWMTPPQPSFQGRGIFEVQYLKNGASYGQSYYRTVIGSHTLYRMVPRLMTLSDLWSGFQGQDIFWSRISRISRGKVTIAH